MNVGIKRIAKLACLYIDQPLIIMQPLFKVQKLRLDSSILQLRENKYFDQSRQMTFKSKKMMKNDQKDGVATQM
jgi:hypothetical protein